MNKHLLQSSFLKTFFDTKIATMQYLEWQAGILNISINYLYLKEELEPWASKVKILQKETPVVRSYFNSHHGAKAVVNAFQFKVSRGQNLTVEHEKALTHAQNHISQISHGSKFDHYLTKPNLIDGMNKI